MIRIDRKLRSNYFLYLFIRLHLCTYWKVILSQPRQRFIYILYIYNTLFRKLLTRYSQIFEEERSFSKFHTSINSSRETNFKSLLSLRREKFFDFFTLLPASEELLSGISRRFFPICRLSQLSFLLPVLLSSFERAGSTGC